MFDRLLIVWLSLASLLAFFWPAWFPALADWDPFKASGGLLAALLLVNVLGYAAGYVGGRLLKLPEPMTRA